MESKPLLSNVAVLSEEKVSLESEVQHQQLDLRWADIEGNVLMISGTKNESSLIAVQDTHNPMTALKEKILFPNDVPATSDTSKASMSESGATPIATPIHQSLTQLSDPTTIDRKFTADIQNQSAPCIAEQKPEKPEDEAILKSEKIKADCIKTVKRENCKGWF